MEQARIELSQQEQREALELEHAVRLLEEPELQLLWLGQELSGVFDRENGK